MNKSLSFETVRELALALPDVVETTSWGNPSLKAAGKLLACVPGHKSAEPRSVAIFVPIARRAELMRTDPETFYAPHHYQMHAVVLARLDMLTRAELKALVEEAHHAILAKKKARKKGARQGLGAPGGDGMQVTVRSPNKPGYEGRIDKAKYDAMKPLVLRVFPKTAPGKTQSELMAALKASAPKTTFPGTTYRWWGKSVQLDLEARGELVREASKPLRWHRA
jgi:hypothetical protein